MDCLLYMHLCTFTCGHDAARPGQEPRLPASSGSSSSTYTNKDFEKVTKICLLFVIRYVKKTPAERYGKPMMVPSSDSRAGSDGCQNQGQGLGSASDEEDTFPPSYQPPLVGLMSKGMALQHTLL